MKNLWEFFFDFFAWRKLKAAYKLKFDQIEVFCENSHFDVFGPEMEPKWRFSGILKSNAWNFSDFLHEVKVT